MYNILYLFDLEEALNSHSLKSHKGRKSFDIFLKNYISRVKDKKGQDSINPVL